MNKIRTLIKAPILTNSGYGQHSRMIFEALASDPLFDIAVEALNWGHCSWTSDESEKTTAIKKCVEKGLMNKHQGNENYDLFIHVTIPNEFEKKGKFNVGVTAGIETDKVSHVWLQKCNEMNLVIVPSEHAKKVFVETVHDWQNQKTGEIGQLKLEVPMMICHEGVDSNLFKEKVYQNKISLELESDFNFLHVGQWGKGGFGEDRKNIALMLKIFLETFRGNKNVGLVLKTSMAKNSDFDNEIVLSRIKEIKQAIGITETESPPIYLIHANLTEEEMADLYNHPKIKAYLSLTHGEGFGIPTLEAAMCGLPVITTNWSGHLDFLKEGKFIPLEYDLQPIPDAAVWEPLLIKGSRWACVKEEDTSKKISKITKAYLSPKMWAKELAEKVKEKFDLKKVNDNFISVVKESMLKVAGDQISPVEHLQAFIDTPTDFNVIYTMPMSTGDVFISTAVIDGLKKEMPPDAKIYFATDPKYFDILKGNPNIHKCIPYSQVMMHIDLLEQVFDIALTPNIATQFTFSNWVRKGQGRLLAEEFANHCNTELGDYFIEKDRSVLTEHSHKLFTTTNEVTESGATKGVFTYMTFHPGSGKGQWEARKYIDWKEILMNLKSLCPNLRVVQVGGTDEPLFAESDLDLRGKTTPQQLASVIENSLLHLSIDTFTMHMAAAMNTPLVALFGSSHASSTGPWVKDKEKAKYILLEAEDRMGCNKACYKYTCQKNKDTPCVNSISAEDVFTACFRMLSIPYAKPKAKLPIVDNEGVQSDSATV